MLIGKLGADAEIRQVGQSTVAEFRLATSERWKNQNGEFNEDTTWHTVTLWNQPGVHPFLTKGREIYVEGMYKSKDWQDQSGNKRRDYFVKAFAVQLVGTNPQAHQGAPQQAPQQQPPMQQQYQAPPQFQQPMPPAQPPMPPQQPYQAPPFRPQCQQQPAMPPQQPYQAPPFRPQCQQQPAMPPQQPQYQQHSDDLPF